MMQIKVHSYIRSKHDALQAYTVMTSVYSEATLGHSLNRICIHDYVYFTKMCT